MKILTNAKYESLMEDSECLHRFWKDEKQKAIDEKQKEKEKKDAELEKLPDAPRKFCCDNCDGTGYSKKKFKVFKDERYVIEKVICIDCLERIMRKDYIDDDGGY